MPQLVDACSPGEMESTYLFCSRGFHGTRGGVRGLHKARTVGGSRSKSLGYQVSLQPTLGKRACAFFAGLLDSPVYHHVYTDSLSQPTSWSAFMPLLANLRN